MTHFLSVHHLEEFLLDLEYKTHLNLMLHVRCKNINFRKEQLTSRLTTNKGSQDLFRQTPLFMRFIMQFHVMITPSSFQKFHNFSPFY